MPGVRRRVRSKTLTIDRHRHLRVTVDEADPDQVMVQLKSKLPTLAC